MKVLMDMDTIYCPSGMAFYNRNMFENFKGHLLIGSLKFKSLYLRIMDNLPISEEIIFKIKLEE